MGGAKGRKEEKKTQVSASLLSPIRNIRLMASKVPRMQTRFYKKNKKHCITSINFANKLCIMLFFYLSVIILNYMFEISLD